MLWPQWASAASSSQLQYLPRYLFLVNNVSKKSLATLISLHILILPLLSEILPSNSTIY